ncbi:MAG TPA: hypothetical protein DEQ38_04085 [Elusimicrobia bacterium]|nr:MAG: hypothetical protein A2089_12845 [Elusimicrobia bacterium GWD2_63_28]HCC47282.1 hypothetical protein [Elusimicrobiota bacterium]
MALKITVINGSYRRGGITDQAAEAAAAAARAGGAEVEMIRLAERRVEFCLNCRACTQEPGPARGRCVQRDDMDAILDSIEASSGLILAAPVNFFNVNALTRRFMERLVPYAWWPWGAMAPAPRVKDRKIKAVLITSSAMPSVAGRLLTGSMRALKMMAATLGAKTAGTLFVGLASMEEKPELPARDRRLAERLGRKLL